MVTYITAQGSIGFGILDLGQVLGERVLMFGLFIVCFVIQLKDTRHSGSAVSTAGSVLAVRLSMLFTDLADKLSVFPC